jgi:acetyl-CoA carboxylase biotin carboxyl carrier protein
VAKAKPPVKTKSGSGSGSDLSRLEQVLELMGKHQLSELEWKSGGTEIRARSALAGPAVVHHSAPVHHAPAVHHSAPAPAAAAPAAEKKAAASPSNHKQILSPFVGTFYRSPRPGADSYVREGQQVKRGDVLCIVEAMKLMNEIESDFNGKIVSILVENGQAVEFDEPLFVIEASG